MKTVLVTGGTGLIGGALIRTLTHRGGYRIRAAVRRSSARFPNGVTTVRVAGLVPGTDLSRALAGVDAVVHAAARVHVIRDTASDPLTAFREVNTDGTRRLAERAAGAGVRRFLFLSTIKVHGEYTDGRPFRPEDPPAPQEPYSVSKYEAELHLREIEARTGMEVCVIRPPLVYGPGVKGNFQRLMSWVQRGVPLPLGSVRNRRSLVCVYNLCDLIARCIVHPAAAGKTFLVSDGEDVSTPDLVQRLARALGRAARLLPVPPGLLRWGFTLLGRREEAARLCQSLQVDIEETQRMLGWHPPVSLDEGLKKTVQWYRNQLKMPS